jgi:hypothetical protein
MEHSLFMQKSLIAQKVMEDSGLGSLRMHHITWLANFTKEFFNTPYSIVVVYFTNKNKYLYLQPSLERPISSSQASPLPEDLFNSPKVDTMTIKQAEQGLPEFLSLQEYKIKIVRDLPKAVRKSPNVKQLVT